MASEMSQNPKYIEKEYIEVVRVGTAEGTHTRDSWKIYGNSTTLEHFRYIYDALGRAQIAKLNKLHSLMNPAQVDDLELLREIAIKAETEGMDLYVPSMAGQLVKCFNRIMLFNVLSQNGFEMIGTSSCASGADGSHDDDDGRKHCDKWTFAKVATTN